MNKHSVKSSVRKSRPAKASRNQVARKAVARRISGKVEPSKPIQVPTPVPNQVPTHQAATGAVAKQIAMPGAMLRAHKFRVGQTVLYTSSPITRPGASGSYKVVKLLPSDGDDYQYRIKNSGEAFERVAKESQLETEH
jgi:hypothetical protein